MTKHFDATEITQKILSTIVRTQERYGATTVTDILTGAKTKNIREFELDQLPVYGIAPEFTKDNIRELIESLSAAGLIGKKLPKNLILRLTPRGRDFLKNRETVQLPIPQKQKEDHPIFEPITGYDEELFGVLWLTRQTMAREQDVRPFEIFSDLTLKIMAAFFPSAIEDLYQIPEIGAQKIEQYGPIFTDAVKAYADSENINPENQDLPKFKIKKVELKPRTVEILKKIQAGSTVSQIAQANEVSEETILQHVEYLILAGEIKSIDAFIPEEKYKAIREVYASKPEMTLGEKREMLGDDFTFGDLRLVRAFLLSTPLK